MKSLFPALLLLVPLLSFSQVPVSNHVFLIVEENHGYSDVVGNPQMPFLNQLASTYGLATQYFANVHPSIGNYFMLTTGQVITTDDSFSGTVAGDNIVRELLLAGKTWKVYAEDLPHAGYVGPDVYPYVQHHNPFSYFADAQDSGMQAGNLVPFPQFAMDLAGQALPNFSFLLPNIEHDAHACIIRRAGCDDASLLRSADHWLQTNLSPLLLTPWFQPGGDGLLIIVFDEARSSDNNHGGGHVAAILVGPNVVAGTQSSTLHQHQDLLHLICSALALSSCPGLAASAPDLREFFPTPQSQTIATPPPAPTIPSVPTPTAPSAPAPPPHPAPASPPEPTPRPRGPQVIGVGQVIR